MRNKINLELIGKILPFIGILLLIFIIYNIGVLKILNTFKLIPIQYYLLALIPLTPKFILHVLKWQYISKKQKIYVNFFPLLKIFLISSFYGMITPGGIGWHIRIFYLSKKSKASFEKCLANSLIDITISFTTGVCFAILGAIIIFDFFPAILPILLLILIFYLGVLSVLLKKRRGDKLFRFFIRPLIPSRYRKGLDQSIDSLYEDIPKFRDMIIPFFIDSMAWLLMGVQAYIIALAFDPNIPFLPFILISILSVIATGILPIAIGGIGVREGVFVFLATSYLGLEADIALVISLSGFVVKLLIPSVIGFVLSLRYKIK